MFTGLISQCGQLLITQDHSIEDKDLTIEIMDLDPDWLKSVMVGDSIAVDGVCLTVTVKSNTSFAATLSQETVKKSMFGTQKTSGKVNLEKALTLQDRLGGHLVSGHVDAMTELKEIKTVKESHELHFLLPIEGAELIAPKGSITINGVSLTVNEVTDSIFTVMVIPHTWQMTNLSEIRCRDKVHLEFDMIARYVARLLDKPKRSLSLKSTDWTALLNKL